MIELKQLIYLSPELAVLTIAMILLLIDGLLIPRTKHFIFILLTLGIAASFFFLRKIDVTGFALSEYGLHLSPVTQQIKQFMLLVCLSTLYIGNHFLLQHKNLLTEFIVLSLFSLLGGMFLVSASGYLTLYLSLQLLSMPLYALIVLNVKSEDSNEAAFKFFVLGSLASGLFLFGLSLIYGVTGHLDFIGVVNADKIVFMLGFALVLVAMFIELGIVPFHMWLPDVYQSAPLLVSLQIATIPKIALAFICWRLLQIYDFSVDILYQIIMFLSMLSLLIGSLFGLTQRSIKKILAYSTIHHMGFVLLAILVTKNDTINYVLLYVAAYVIASMVAFGCLLQFKANGLLIEEVSDLAGISKLKPYYSLALMLSMLSMAGIPPLLGFHAKFIVLNQFINTSNVLVPTVILCMSVMGVLYYLRVIRWLYFVDPITNLAIDNNYSRNIAKLILCVLGVLPLLFGIWPNLLNNLIS